MSTLHLDHLLDPRSIVVVGASSRPSSPGYKVTANIVSYGYKGTLYFVNPRHDEIMGLTCYPSIKSIPSVTDLAIVLLPSRKLKRCLSQCAKRGIKTVMIMSGSAESKVLLKHATELGIRLLGPYCAGLIRPHSKLNISLSSNDIDTGSLALVSESASLGAAILDWAETSGVGFSALLSTGRYSEITLSDLLDLLTEDWQTQAVIIYVESVVNARSFMSALSALARVKPVVLMRSAEQAGYYCDVYTKTGEIISSDIVLQAALNRAGAVQIRTFANLFSAAKILSSKLRVRGNRLAIVSNGSAPAMMSLERMMIKHFQVPPIDADTHQKMVERLGEKSLLNNPFILRDASNLSENMPTLVSAIKNLNSIDAILVIFVPDSRNRADELAQSLIKTLPCNKPILACWMGDASVIAARESLLESGIPTFRTPEAAIDGFDFLHRYHVSQQQLLQLPNPLSSTTRADTDGAKRLVDQALKDGLRLLPNTLSNQLLRFYDISTSNNRIESNIRILSISLYQDPTFGPVIRLGIAGEFTQSNFGGTVQLPPLNRFLIDQILDVPTIKGYLGRYQEHEAVASEAVAHVMRRISEMACELPALYSINIDSLLVTPEQAIAKDVQICLQNPIKAPRYSHLAIHPYPKEWVRSFELKNNETIQLRPIRPEDASSINKLVKEMSPESRYFRFMHAVNELSPYRVAQFTKLDYDRQMAFVAINEQQDVIGVSRYVINSTRLSAEFAISISDNWKRQGLAMALMKVLIEHARSQKILSLYGDVLTNNTPMQALMKALNFSSTPHSDHEDAIRFEKVLDTPVE